MPYGNIAPSPDFAAKVAASAYERESRMQNTGAALGGTAPRDMSQLEQAMNSNSNAIHELASCLDALEQRLKPVMRPVPPQAEGKGLQGVDVAHSMAVEQMHIQRRQIENLIGRLNDINARLET